MSTNPATALLLNQGDAWLEKAIGAPDAELDAATIACAYYLRVVASNPGGGLNDLLVLAQAAQAQKQAAAAAGADPPATPANNGAAATKPAPNRATRRKTGGPK